MKDMELLFGMLLLGIVGLTLLAPLFLLRIKGVSHHGKKAQFRVTGKLLTKGSGSIGLPTHSFNVFPDGLLLSGFFNERFIPLEEIQSVEEGETALSSCIEIKLRCGESLKLATANNHKLKAHLRK